MMTLWKCATRNKRVVQHEEHRQAARLSSTPVMPPMVKVIMKASVHIIGISKRMRPAKHREQPVEDLLAPVGIRDDHRGDAEERVDAGARPHGEEVVQPDEVSQHA